MIEKIKNKTGTYCGQTLPIRQDTIINKINELVDAVNRYEDIIRQIGEWSSSKGECLWCENLTEVNLDTETRAENVQPYAESRPENVHDKFAEQRKWIGKLCMFWDEALGEKVWGILGGINYSENTKYPYWCDQLQEQYQCCEPVKPDNDIIYKGE